MFLFKNSTLPSKFNNLFSMNNQIHNYSTRSAESICLQLCTTSTRQFSVYFQGQKFYNSLNAKITKSPTYIIHLLQKGLKNFFSIGISRINRRDTPGIVTQIIGRMGLVTTTDRLSLIGFFQVSSPSASFNFLYNMCTFIVRMCDMTNKHEWMNDKLVTRWCWQNK